MSRRGSRPALHHTLAASRTLLEGRLAGPGGRGHRFRYLDHALHRHDRLQRRRDTDQLRRNPDDSQPLRGDRDGGHRRIRRRLPGRQPVDPRTRGHGHGAGSRGDALHRHGRDPAGLPSGVRRSDGRRLHRGRRGRGDRRALGGGLHPRLLREPGRERRHGDRRHRDALHRHGGGDGTRPERREPRRAPTSRPRSSSRCSWGLWSSSSWRPSSSCSTRSWSWATNGTDRWHGRGRATTRDPEGDHEGGSWVRRGSVRPRWSFPRWSGGSPSVRWSWR